MPGKLTATKLKSLMKSLPGKVLLECTQDGNLDLYLWEEVNYVLLGNIDFNTGGLSLIRCPTCALDLEPMIMKGKWRCPSCKNTFQE